VLLAKNLAYFWLAALQSLPLLVALWLTLPPRLSLALVGLHASLVLLSAGRGNAHSLNHPIRRQLFGLEASGGGAELKVLSSWGMATTIMLLCGGVLDTFDELLGLPLLPLGALMLAGLGLSLWWRGLHRAGRDLERLGPELSEALGG
jgi:hypothetical protein